jgi:putative tricarboxylic transport membrane protein
MKKYDLYCGIFWIGLSLLMGGISVLRLSLGTLCYPAPGFYPFLVSALLFCISLILIVRVFMDRKKDPDSGQWPSFGRNVPITMGALLAYALILEYLGYIISTSLLLVFLFKVTASRNWRVSLLMTAVVMIISYYFFVVLLQSQLPMGLLE